MHVSNFAKFPKKTLRYPKSFNKNIGSSSKCIKRADIPVKRLQWKKLKWENVTQPNNIFIQWKMSYKKSSNTKKISSGKIATTKRTDITKRWHACTPIFYSFRQSYGNEMDVVFSGIQGMKWPFDTFVHPISVCCLFERIELRAPHAICSGIERGRCVIRTKMNVLFVKNRFSISCFLTFRHIVINPFIRVHFHNQR